jgi:hypothetical protein
MRPSLCHFILYKTLIQFLDFPFKIYVASVISHLTSLNVGHIAISREADLQNIFKKKHIVYYTLAAGSMTRCYSTVL